MSASGHAPSHPFGVRGGLGHSDVFPLEVGWGAVGTKGWWSRARHRTVEQSQAQKPPEGTENPRTRLSARQALPRGESC